MQYEKSTNIYHNAVFAKLAKIALSTTRKTYRSMASLVAKPIYVSMCKQIVGMEENQQQKLHMLGKLNYHIKYPTHTNINTNPLGLVRLA